MVFCTKSDEKKVRDLNPRFTTEKSVLLGTMRAFRMLSLLAFFFGKILSQWLHQKLLKKIVGVAFIILGVTYRMF